VALPSLARRCIATSFVFHSDVSAGFCPSRRESNDRDHKAMFVASVIARSGVRHGGKKREGFASARTRFASQSSIHGSLRRSAGSETRISIIVADHRLLAKPRQRLNREAIEIEIEIEIFADIRALSPDRLSSRWRGLRPKLEQNHKTFSLLRLGDAACLPCASGKKLFDVCRLRSLRRSSLDRDAGFECWSQA